MTEESSDLANCPTIDVAGALHVAASAEGQGSTAMGGGQSSSRSSGCSVVSSASLRSNERMAATPSDGSSSVTSELDVAKATSVLRPIQVLPGLLAHTVGNLVGGASLSAGWALGKADAKIGGAKQVSDSGAFKMGFRTWLYANGIWPTVVCETGPYGNDFGPLPQDFQARCNMLRSTALFVSNHVSYLDTVVLPLVLEVPKLMAMAEVRNWPLFGQLCQEMDMLWVDRSNSDSRKAAKKAIEEHVGEWEVGQRPLLIWPEGTTSNGRGMKEFKSGAFCPGVAVRPVIIKYTGQWDPSNVHFREVTCSENSPCESTTKYGDADWAQQFLGHMIHSCTVLVCRPYVPSEHEKKDPELFKDNVRKLMLERLGELSDWESRRRSKESTRGSFGAAANRLLNFTGIRFN
mmetsp:Transcript_109248/g.308166  ORF Transcript_109248/g.308166 Transcript_109248/m.308166 type:complete len:405 (-) Transcript_109248:186-1400(-)